jgi:hypothetical protein
MGVYGLVSSYSVLGRGLPVMCMSVMRCLLFIKHTICITLILFLACPLSAKKVKCGSCTLFNFIREALFITKITDYGLLVFDSM